MTNSWDNADIEIGFIAFNVKGAWEWMSRIGLHMEGDVHHAKEIKRNEWVKGNCNGVANLSNCSVSNGKSVSNGCSARDTVICAR